MPTQHRDIFVKLLTCIGNSGAESQQRLGILHADHTSHMLTSTENWTLAALLQSFGSHNGLNYLAYLKV